MNDRLASVTHGRKECTVNVANTDAGDAFAPLLTAAQALLSTTLNAQVHLTNAERLTDEERRNVILRCTVTDAAYGQPASVIIKQVVTEHYDPDTTDSWDTQRFFRDWAGAQFLSTIATESPHSPRFYGGDRTLGFIILEDLGVHHSLVEPLLEADARSAEQALLTFATQLGKLHADTIGTATRFEEIARAISPSTAADVQTSCLQQATELRTQAEHVRVLFDRLDVQVAAHFSQELALISDAIARPGAFLAYIHGDPCPDNVFYTSGRLQLIDFEFGHFGHALRDGVYGRMLFPTCWCANQIPEMLVGRMEQVYRAELMRTCLAAHDDRTFETALVTMCGYWLIVTLAWLLERVLDEDYTWGIATVRPRILARLQAFIATSATYNQLPAFRSTANALLESLDKRWPDTQPLPVYPSFRS
jgi:Phosphotransferase enzyme family